MKTTVEIADSILDEAREVARRESSTLRSLVEEGLHLAVERRRRAERFRLRDASVDGEGRHPELRDASWEEIRHLAYGDRS